MKILSVLPGLALTVGAAFASPSLTIYNQDFAVVRDTVPLDLKKGVNDVSFTDTTARLEPDSVILRDPSGRMALQILEQNYRNDPVSQELLLSLNEGKTIDFVVKQPDKPDQMVAGRIVRSGYHSGEGPRRGGQPAAQPIIERDGKLQFGLPGQPLFPSLGDDTILKPTLDWKIQAESAAKLDAELAYITGGMSWQATYNIVASANSDLIDVIGWITIDNQSGKNFSGATVKLMAGDVNKIQPVMLNAMAGARFKAMDAAPAVTEKAFEDYHLYSLPRPTTLHDGETKQVEFIHASGVKARKVYVYDGADIDWNQWRGNPVGARQDEGFGSQSSSKVAIMREFNNSEENHLGMPLPQGRLRFYKRDDQALEFTGENTIDHTPRDETLKVNLGNAFDLVGERTRTSVKIDEANHFANESFTIKLRNHKEEPVEIRVVEHLYRGTNWTIADNTAPFVKTNAQEIEYVVQVKPGAEKTISYRAHYTW